MEASSGTGGGTDPSATPAAGPTATATATEGSPNVQIASIFYDGLVTSTEADEYVEIVNEDDAGQDPVGWRLLDFADDGPEFTFPAWTLGLGVVVRVYTNEIHSQWGGFSFGSGSAIWNNDDPDNAGLYNDDGELLSIKSYPPGCD